MSQHVCSSSQQGHDGEALSTNPSAMSPFDMADVADVATVPPPAPAMRLPSFLTVSSSNAKSLTLTAADCHDLGMFPYFLENISGSFVRFRLHGATGDGPESYAWARILHGVTANALADMGSIAPSQYGPPGTFEDVADASAALRHGGSDNAALAAAWSSIPAMWRRRLLDEPVYAWRNRRYEVYLICEHPFTHVLSGAGSPAAASPSPPSQSHPPFLVSFRQLAKDSMPTRAEIDAYCAQFVPIQDSTTGLATPTGHGALTAAIPRYVPQSFIDAFLTAPDQSAQEVEEERLAALDVRKTSVLVARRAHEVLMGVSLSAPTPLPTQPSSLPAAAEDPQSQMQHAAAVGAATRRRSQAFDRAVRRRTLDKADARKIVEANTRLSNIRGNIVVRNAVTASVSLQRQAELEALRRKEAADAAASQKRALASNAVRRATNAANAIDNEDLDPDGVAADLTAQTQLTWASQPLFSQPTAAATSHVDIAGYVSPPEISSLSALLADRSRRSASMLLPSATPAAFEPNGSAAASPHVADVMGALHCDDGGSVSMLTQGESVAFDALDQAFHDYVTDERRSKNLAVLADITERNRRANISIQLRGRINLERRDEKSADSDATMWVTQQDQRLVAIAEYEAERSGQNKDDSKKAAAALAPRYPTHKEHLEMVAREASGVRDAQRPFQQLLSGSGADDVDALMSLASRSLSLARSGSSGALLASQGARGTSSHVPSSQPAPLDDVEERLRISSSLCRMPSVVLGQKRERQEA